VATLANAMDVGDPSNFERLRWFFRQRDLRHVGIHAHSVSDERIRERIAQGQDSYGQVFCPHTACAVEIYEQLRRAGHRERMLLVATAHPAKFDEVVEPLVGHRLVAPPALAELLARPAQSEMLDAQADALVARLESGW
jgi:threonine synthase